jgi:hypothetical protein
MTEWNLDFTCTYYRKIMSVFREKFHCVMFSDVPALSENPEKPYLVLRHDIDVDPAVALKLALIEREFGLKSTYFVMLDNLLYRLSEAIEPMKEILSMGNEIGLHFSGNTLDEIEEHCKTLENALGCTVHSVSFHRPKKEWLQGELYIGKRINAYAKPLMNWYISDSRGRFRAGEPLTAIAERKGNVLQFLTHPIWWGQHANPVQNLVEWFEKKTEGCSSAEKEKFAQCVYEQIDVMPMQ